MGCAVRMANASWGELVSELGQYQRLWFTSKGLLNNQTCPSPWQVAVIADTDQRTRKTGEAFLAGLAPKCQIQVHYQKDEEKLILFLIR